MERICLDKYIIAMFNTYNINYSCFSTISKVVCKEVFDLLNECISSEIIFLMIPLQYHE